MPTTTFNYTAAQATRMAAAFQKELGLASPATEPQIKAEIWNFVRLVCARQEETAAVTPAVATAKASLTDLGQPT